MQATPYMIDWLMSSFYENFDAHRYAPVKKPFADSLSRYRGYKGGTLLE